LLGDLRLVDAPGDEDGKSRRLPQPGRLGRDIGVVDPHGRDHMDRAAEPRHGAQGGVDVVNGLEPSEFAADGLNLAGVEAIGFHFLR
jgi:hypothetical protein